MRTVRWRTHSAAAAALLLAGCARGRTEPVGSPGRSPLPDPAIAADSVRTDTVAPGVVHRFYYLARGPWAVHVLDVDRAACWTAVAAKGGKGAAGRRLTSEIAAHVAAGAPDSGARTVAGAVNADFFVLASGVPQAAHVRDGAVVAGPNARPVFALVGRERRPWIGRMSAQGGLVVGGDSVRVDAANRYVARGVALFDRQWGERTDSASRAIELTLRLLGPAAARKTLRFAAALDTAPEGVPLPHDGIVLVVGRDADPALRARLSALHGSRVDVSGQGVETSPADVREAVGGRPVVLRDGREAEGLDSSGGPGFGPARHPRTAVGFDSSGRRLLLVTVDGRQPGYSEGMTLRELAALMEQLGAHEALNLDGGGSTTMVVRGRAPAGALRVANRPSDKEGERTVGNALVVVRDRTCTIR